MVALEAKSLVFHSELDELCFFESVGKIKCIQSWEGIGISIFIYLKSKHISDICLRELISLFKRYKINMSQLADFVNDKNKIWFMDEEAYWYKEVFKI